MHLVYCRLILLLGLLAVDWVSDPYFGSSPLSAPLSSQEVFCQSFADRVELSRLSTAQPDWVPLSISWLEQFRTPEVCLLACLRLSAPLRGNLVYLFRSIRC